MILADTGNLISSNDERNSTSVGHHYRMVWLTGVEPFAPRSANCDSPLRALKACQPLCTPITQRLATLTKKITPISRGDQYVHDYLFSTTAITVFSTSFCTIIDHPVSRHEHILHEYKTHDPEKVRLNNTNSLCKHIFHIQFMVPMIVRTVNNRLSTFSPTLVHHPCIHGDILFLNSQKFLLFQKIERPRLLLFQENQNSEQH